MGPYLEEVCSKEGIQAQAGVLRLAMRAGGGSMRDTLSVLDQLMVGARDNTITQDSAIALLGFTPETLIGAAIDAIIDCNGEGLYEVVQKVVVGGFDPRRFVEDLLSRVRDLLVLTLGGAHAQSVLSDDAEAENLQELHRQASSLGLQALTQIAQIINETFASMSGATSPRMRLELLAARLLSYRFAQQDHAASSPSDADSGLDRQSVSRKPAQTGGFIGSRRSERQESRQDSAKLYAAGQERAHTQARTQEDAQAQELPHTSSEAGSPSQTGAAVEGTKGVAAPVAHTSVAHAPSTHTLPAQPSNSSINPSNGNPSNSASGSAAPVSVVPASVDERWDALVNALPADVREYVTRAKVPSVALDVANSGRQRLRMTFDTPLSQHAFALAVASEGVEGETSVPKIVLLMVRHSFGEGSFIAPSPTAADGQAVESTRKMSPQQLADVKRRIALSKAGLSAASLGMSTNRNPGANTSEKAGAAKAPAGSSAHGGHADSDHRASAQQDDGVQESDSAHHRGNAVGSGDALEDDPWAQPGPSRSAYAQSAHAQGEASAAPRHGDSHKKKTVAVPDMSDDDDPWASPSASDAQIIQHDSNLDASGESSPGSDSVQAGVQPNQHFLGVHTATNEEHRSPNPAAAAQTSDDVPHAPQVDADDDTYSMQDESLSDGNVLDMEEIKRIFDVKQVETYQADDPLNPVNIEHHKQQGHE
jgi:DNA polymerase-3 subunit gamma/tau